MTRVSFHKKDKERYSDLRKKIDSDKSNIELLNIEYEFNKFKLSNALFSYILLQKRPDLLKYTSSYKIIIKELNRDNDIWLKKTNNLGLYDDKTGILKFHMYAKTNPTTLSILWLMFHEFRHHIQFNNKNIKSCLDNNRKMWLEYYKKNINSVLHVFHEIDPLEVEANTFACDMLDIPYPNTKFSITKETLKRLKNIK